MKKTFLKAVALTAAITFGTASVGFAAGGSIGFGDISVYKSGKLVSKLSGQNPVEDGSLLVCDSKCMIKSEGISLIGRDNAKMAVASEDETFKIYVKEGKVDYVINSNVRKISFHTPQGTYTVAEVVFNASNQSVVKGSVVVLDDGTTEISVTEGRMIFASAEGMKTVDANNKIVLAQADVPEGGDDDNTGLIIAGVGAALVGGFVLYEIIDDDDDDDPAPVASPDTGDTGTTTTTTSSRPSSSRPDDDDDDDDEDGPIIPPPTPSPSA